MRASASPFRQIFLASGATHVRRPCGCQRGPALVGLQDRAENGPGGRWHRSVWSARNDGDPAEQYREWQVAAANATLLVASLQRQARLRASMLVGPLSSVDAARRPSAAAGERLRPSRRRSLSCSAGAVVSTPPSAPRSTHNDVRTSHILSGRGGMQATPLVSLSRSLPMFSRFLRDACRARCAAFEVYRERVAGIRAAT